MCEFFQHYIIFMITKNHAFEFYVICKKSQKI
jgi:hypothetical protein